MTRAVRSWCSIALVLLVTKQFPEFRQLFLERFGSLQIVVRTIDAAGERLPQQPGRVRKALAQRGQTRVQVRPFRRQFLIQSAGAEINLGGLVPRRTLEPFV